MKTKSILNHLVRQMKKLDKKEIETHEAIAQATLAKQCVNVLKYELDRAKTMEAVSGTIRDIG